MKTVIQTPDDTTNSIVENRESQKAAPTTDRFASRGRPLWFAANVLIVLLWLRLFWPLRDYFALIFGREDFRTTQVLLVAVLILFALQVRAHGSQLRFGHPPQPRGLPLSLFFGGTVAFMLAECFLAMNTISAMLFVLSGYGLLGLWMDTRAWRRRLAAALMLLGVLPFGEHLQIFVGYPMRISTAKLIGSTLQLVGVPSIGVDTILIFENGVSQVDLPCSGVKSLWTGALFYVSATWIQQRAMTLRWWLLALILPLLLFVANLARVFVLVVVGEVAGFAFMAEMIHVPLGVIAFVVVCGVALLGLRMVRVHDVGMQSFAETSEREEGVDADGAVDDAPQFGGRGTWRSFLWLAPALMLWLGVLILLYTPKPLTGAATVVEPWHFSDRLATEALPLLDVEAARFIRDGAQSVERMSFRWGDISGSMILVTSHSWRAHHRPERCFEVYGLSIDQTETHLTASQQPIRSVRVGNGSDESLYAATYWFQSADQITDDYGVRVWADAKLDRQQWVLVSILFDEVIELHEPEVETLIETLQKTVDERLQLGAQSAKALVPRKSMERELG